MSNLSSFVPAKIPAVHSIQRTMVKDAPHVSGRTCARRRFRAAFLTLLLTIISGQGTPLKILQN